MTASVVAAATIAGVGALAVPAGAIPAGGGDPTDPNIPDRPDLKVTALSASPLTSTWSVSYTVANAGSAPAGSSTLAIGGFGGVTYISIPSLAASTTKSGTVQVPRNDCYVYVSANADNYRVVTELNESNNTRSTIAVVPGCPPRYKVTAVSFKALDESGADWTGSDEPYWIFSTVGTEGTAATRKTQVFGDIDSGDTQYFPITDSCVWGCTSVGEQAPFGIGVSTQLWENDLGNIDEIWFDTAEVFQKVGPILSKTGAPSWVGPATTAVGYGLEAILHWAEDDLIGTNTYAFSPEGLAQALPNRGTSFTDTRVYSDGDADYTLTMTVSRLV